MHANVSTLQRSTMDAEISALKALGETTRARLKKTTPRDIYASIVAEHRRKLVDLAIALEMQPLDALLFQRALPRPSYIPRMSWELDKEYDLVAWVELEADFRLRAVASDMVSILKEEGERFRKAV